MSFAGGAVASSAAVTAAEVAQAIKASGVIVNMEPPEFLSMLDRVDAPLVVTAVGGTINKNYQYLFGHKGLAFFTKSSEKLPLPPQSEIIKAKKIWIPG
ncbi:MAG TPA: hypothetical protein EYP41_12080 [Anaerolineae bacterium]|nr:hypothetical protein [Anaerolineae bacterium]HIP73547.1 hypothetical protein [Anaerolineae bacterium]